MITKNTASPNFGNLIIHDSYRHLGTQGRRSMEFMSPFLKLISQDCDLFVAAVPNSNLKLEKPTLVTIATDLINPEMSFWKSFKDAFVPVVSLSQSCTDAVSPRSLYTNAAMAKTRLMGALGVSDVNFAAQLTEFQNHPDVVKFFEAFENTFTRVPTIQEVNQDINYGQITALKNKKHLYKEHLI